MAGPQRTKAGIYKRTKARVLQILQAGAIKQTVQLDASLHKVHILSMHL